ncbi:ATP-dependent RNA helicase pitchoune, partial [Pseudoloma neurophilia]
MLQEEILLDEFQDRISSFLESFGFESLKPIQKVAFSPIYNNFDTLIECQTGGGKTLAYLLPLLIRQQSEESKEAIHVLLPTYELVDQISNVLKRLNVKNNIYAGSVQQNVNSNITLFTVGCYNKYFISNEKNKEQNILVIDEADRVLAQQPLIFTYDQVILVSATLSNNSIEAYLNRMMDKRVHDKMKTTKKYQILEYYTFEKPSEEITTFYKVSHFSKLKIKKYVISPKLYNLVLLLKKNRHKRSIIFCNTINTVNYLHKILEKLNLTVQKLHGKVAARKKLKNQIKSNAILITSGVMNRGYDFKAVRLIIEFEKGTEIETTHRIGRTGRDTSGTFIGLYRKIGLKKLVFNGKKFTKVANEECKENSENNQPDKKRPKPE